MRPDLQPTAAFALPTVRDGRTKRGVPKPADWSARVAQSLSGLHQHWAIRGWGRGPYRRLRRRRGPRPPSPPASGGHSLPLCGFPYPLRPPPGVMRSGYAHAQAWATRTNCAQERMPTPCVLRTQHTAFLGGAQPWSRMDFAGSPLPFLFRNIGAEIFGTLGRERIPDQLSGGTRA